MHWLLSVDDTGRRIDEYGPGELKRSWAPRQADESTRTYSTINDVVYRKREVGVNWGGKLAVSDHYLAKIQTLDYTVSDGDIYLVGNTGEQWLEPSQNLNHVEITLDNPNNPITPLAGSTPTTAPAGTLKFDTSAFSNGMHTLTLTAVMNNGTTKTLTRNDLKIDNAPPVGTVTSVPIFTRQTATIGGTVTDTHAGPRDWKLLVRRTTDGYGVPISTGTLQAPCPEPDTTVPFSCDWQTGGTTFPDGIYTLYSHQRDLVAQADNGPNESDSPTNTTTVDNTPPRSGFSGAPAGWTRTDPVAITVSATDNLTGVVTLGVTDNSSPIGTPFTDGSAHVLSVAGEGVHNLQSQAQDGAGNTETVPAPTMVKIDHTPPTTASSNPSLCSGWTKQASMALTPTDPLSGVKKLTITKDGVITTATSAGASAAFSGDGTHALLWYAEDNIGNIETEHSCAIHLDATPPSTAVTGVPGGWTNQNATVVLTPTDATSGIEHLHVDVDGQGTDYPGDAPRTVTLNSEGEHTLKVRAYDNAGNSESELTRTIRIDKTPPTTTASGVPTGWSTQPLTVSLRAADGADRSGVANLSYGINDSSETVSGGDSASVSFSSDGLYTLRYHATDVAGNTETAREAVVKLDGAAPSIELSGSLYDARDLSPIYEGENKSLTVTTSDSTSGTSSTELQLDGRAVASGSGSISYTLTADSTLADGQHTFTVIARDNAGNVRREAFVIDAEMVIPPDDGLGEAQPPAAYSGPESNTSSFRVNSTLMSTAPAVGNNLPCTTPLQPANFAVWSLGPAFEGLPVQHVTRECSDPVLPGMPTRFNAVSYEYGSCNPGTIDDVCTYTIQVQSFPACERNLSTYTKGDPDFTVAFDETTANGAPAAIFENGHHIDIYTGASTIALFGNDVAQLRRAADALRQEPAAAPPGFPIPQPAPTDLPEPAPGAMNGSMLCGTVGQVASSVPPLPTGSYSMAAKASDTTRHWNGDTWSTEKNSSCDVTNHKVDPIGVVFHGSGAHWITLTGGGFYQGAIARHTSPPWTYATGVDGVTGISPQGYGSLDDCTLTNAHVTSRRWGNNSTRYHMRLWTQDRVVGGNRYVTVGTPHVDTQRKCDKDWADNYAFKLPGGGTGQGFDYARERLRVRWANTHHHIERKNWGATQTVWQCHGKFPSHGNGDVILITYGQ